MGVAGFIAQKKSVPWDWVEQGGRLAAAERRAHRRRADRRKRTATRLPLHEDGRDENGWPRCGGVFSTIPEVEGVSGGTNPHRAYHG